MQRKGVLNGQKVAKEDINAGRVRYYVKAEPRPSISETADLIEAKYGFEIDFAILGGGELEDDEDFIDGYNTIALNEIRAAHGQRVCDNLSGNRWKELLALEPQDVRRVLIKEDASVD